MQHREVGDLGAERVVDVELLIFLRQLVGVVLHDRDGIGRAEEELGHGVTVHRAEVGGGLDLLLAA